MVSKWSLPPYLRPETLQRGWQPPQAIQSPSAGGVEDDPTPAAAAPIAATAGSRRITQHGARTSADAPRGYSAIEPSQVIAGRRIRMLWVRHGHEFEGVIGEVQPVLDDKQRPSVHFYVKYDDGDCRWYTLHNMAGYHMRFLRMSTAADVAAEAAAASAAELAKMQAGHRLRKPSSVALEQVATRTPSVGRRPSPSGAGTRA